MEGQPGRRRQPADKGRPQSRSVDCAGGKTANQSYTRRGPAVTKHTTEAFSIKYVGLDVRKETIAVAVADSGTAEPRGLGMCRGCARFRRNERSEAAHLVSTTPANRKIAA